MEDYVFVDIKKVIKTDSKILGETKILAHISDKRKSETLEEHTNCCVKYFKRLMEDRKLEAVIDNFVNTFFGDNEREQKLLFTKMLSNIVVFHDFGKINPFYQKNILKNKKFPQCNIECHCANTHSILSSIIYFDYFLNEVNQTGLDKDSQNKLKYFAFLNSYIISKHHSDLSGKNEVNPVEVYRNRFYTNGEASQIINAMYNGQYSELYHGLFSGKKSFRKIIKDNEMEFYKTICDEEQKTMSIYIYAYVKFMYSVLISCDYYATSEYMNGVEIREYGNLDEIDELISAYEKNDRIVNIRKNYQKEDDGKDINILRNKMFMECENNLLKNKENSIFFLEAPTGSGKSNMSVNVSIKLLSETIRKIIYVYPFNTLVEQNMKSLKEIFGKSNVCDKIAVINSIYPMKRDEKEAERLKSEEDEEQFYQKILLDRQFLNYPFILTTHVNLFDIMFGCSKEAAVSFYQLSNSVIVLDEIQSYKNDIWTEIMYFLQCFSKILNIKIVIMSATLPRMDFLTEINSDVTHLIVNRNQYFEDKRFKNRVDISFELLGSTIEFDELADHIMSNQGEDRNILVEFIKKDSAYEFYDFLKDKDMEGGHIYCLTGDYNQADREKILNKISSSKGNILVATQVVEAGVDIDMDIGYKDISKLDSEEQFLGRINRNYKSKFGKAYLFHKDSASGIYKSDFRIESEFTVMQPEMQEILLNKRFDIYYQGILTRIKELLNARLDEKGIDEFINKIKDLRFYEIQSRMKLIQDDEWAVSVFIPRLVTLPDGIVIDGNSVWDKYKELLNDNEMKYAEKQVKLSDIKSKFSYFVFKMRRDFDLNYNDRIGEMYLFEDGEQYIKDGHLDLEGAVLFV